MRQYIKSLLSLILMAFVSWGCTETKNPTKVEEDKGDPFEKIKDPGRYPVGLQLPDHPYLWIAPRDFSPAEGELLRINVSGGSDAVIINSHLEEIKKWIRLTDALSSEISFQTRIQVIEWGEDRIEGELHVIPDEPLKEGWHVFSLARLPEGLTEGTFPMHIRSDDGERFVRFRVGGTWPMLWAIRVCMGESGSKVFLEMTERTIMHGPIEDSVVIAVSGHELACKNMTQLGEGESGGGGKPGGGSFNKISLHCAKLSKKDELTIELSPDLTGLPVLVGSSSAALKGPLVHSFIVGELEDWGPGCKLYRGTVVE